MPDWRSVHRIAPIGTASARSAVRFQPFP